MLVVVIQLSQACGDLQFLMPVPNDENFLRSVLWARILSESCKPFPRGNTSINILVPIRNRLETWNV